MPAALAVVAAAGDLASSWDSASAAAALAVAAAAGDLAS